MCSWLSRGALCTASKTYETQWNTEPAFTNQKHTCILPSLLFFMSLRFCLDGHSRSWKSCRSFSFFLYLPYLLHRDSLGSIRMKAGGRGWKTLALIIGYQNGWCCLCVQRLRVGPKMYRWKRNKIMMDSLKVCFFSRVYISKQQTFNYAQPVSSCSAWRQHQTRYITLLSCFLLLSECTAVPTKTFPHTALLKQPDACIMM